MRGKIIGLLVLLLAFWVQACSSDDGVVENYVFPFEGYDIMHSGGAADDDVAGRFSVVEGADPWRPGDIVYLERDGLFVYRDKQGRWSRNWGYAAHYGTYNPKGVRPIPGQRYYCTQTDCQYIADENGRLTPVDAPTTRFKVATWNIGGFNNGNSGSFSVKSEEKYEEILARFSPIIELIDADLIGLCEYLPSIYGEREISADLMGEYPYEAESEVSGKYLGKALFSRFPLRNPKMLRIYQSIALEADVTIGGRVFKVCICHPFWWDTDGDPNWHALVSMANRYKYVDRVILMGDFNIHRTRAEESLRLFTQAGFTPANMGMFGSIITSYNSVKSVPWLDNIFVKGAEIESVSTIQFTPEGLDPQNPQIEDEPLWDAVNPSDHFPFSATLVIK